jgi:drug/metabolite transporter (DMT)-like permease
MPCGKAGPYRVRSIALRGEYARKLVRRDPRACIDTDLWPPEIRPAPGGMVWCRPGVAASGGGAQAAQVPVPSEEPGRDDKGCWTMKGERGPGGGTTGLAAVILGTVAWGCTGIFVKEIRLAALPITFYRLWLGTVLLGVLLLARRRPPSLAALARSIPGGLFLALDMGLFFSALKLTSVAVATVVGALQPALVLLVAGRFFGERVGWRVVVWTLVSMAGVAAVALGTGVPRGEHLTGDALAVGSLIAFTGYWLVSKQVVGGSASSDHYTFGVMLVAAAAMTPVVFLSGEHLGPVRPADWWWLALLALVPGSGHLLVNFAHRVVDVSVSSVVSAGNPVVASLLALVVLGEPLGAVQVAGGIVAVVAIAAVARQSGQAGRPRRPPGGQVKAVASGVRRSTSSGPARSGSDTNTVRTPVPE